MSVIWNGTRTPNTAALTVGAATRSVNNSFSLDAGLAARVTGALVFTASGPQGVTLAGAFGSFPANTQVLVSGSNLNNSLFYVQSVSANALVLSPPPKPETLVSATIRVA